jgi:hypothetical protein
VKLVDQWRRIEDDLPAEWTDVTLDVDVETASDRPRAASLLGPANPGRVGDALRLHVRRGGGPASVGTDGVRRLFGNLDTARVWSSLRLVDVAHVPGTEEAAAADAEPETAPLAERWDAALATLPPDWSDVHAELRFHSTDYVPRAALLCAPLNPTSAGRLALRFRAARRAGYGASQEMVKRCLERLDAEAIEGDFEILRVLSETRHVATQGPVWRVGGRSV